MNNTKELILERALNLFNEKGIEYGGMRELAKLLDIRVSNITYYFPTKDHLVSELAMQLQQLNSAAAQQYDCSSLKGFLDMQLAIFHNQYRYRSLLISFVHIFTNNPITADNYKLTEQKRRGRLKDIFNRLTDNGYLKKETSGDDIQMLVSHIAFIARFWQSEAVISHDGKTTEEIIFHYFTMICNVLEPHTTEKGRDDMSDFLKKISA